MILRWFLLFVILLIFNTQHLFVCFSLFIFGSQNICVMKYCFSERQHLPFLIYVCLLWFQMVYLCFRICKIFRINTTNYGVLARSALYYKNVSPVLLFILCLSSLEYVKVDIINWFFVNYTMWNYSIVYIDYALQNKSRNLKKIKIKLCNYIYF